MTLLVAVSKVEHLNKCWNRYADYQFAAGDAVAPLVVAEMSRAAVHLPIAFIAQGEEFVPVALQGLAPGKNLLVAPDGRWLAGYTPSLYRSYPFQLATAEDGQMVLCVDQDSGLVVDGTEGEPFFEGDAPSKSVSDVLEFLKQTHASRLATSRICQVLQKHDLFEPWPITLKDGDKEQKVEGLFRINETVLSALSPDALAEVRDAGALVITYCQLLSMQHLNMLAELARVRSHADITRDEELNLDFLNKSDTLTFN
ncbi:SapC family protein [Nitrincola alkalilacustris]|uniref:SapC family protein n=1 Tax=Nitrincola alkalilacustris TaxID=1571224 RepID=UPI00124DEDA9|nr:SapC family protein [Nitrincola alkalilacustris]